MILFSLIVEQTSPPIKCSLSLLLFSKLLIENLIDATEILNDEDSFDGCKGYALITGT